MFAERDCLIVTNNSLPEICLKEHFRFDYRPEASCREILIAVRDMVYLGHTLYTHPLSGSVKPGENPYKSVAVSSACHKFQGDQAKTIANAIEVFDRFAPADPNLPDKLLEDLRLVDYVLLCSGIGFDAAAGFSIIKDRRKSLL